MASPGSSPFEDIRLQRMAIGAAIFCAIVTLVLAWVALTTGGPVNPDRGDPGGPEYLPHWPPTITMCSIQAHEARPVTCDSLIFSSLTPTGVGSPVPISPYYGTCPPFPCPACPACATKARS